jgi:hypothetical protein
LNQVYGQKTIDKIKKYIQTNDLPVVFSYTDLPEKIPCICLASEEFGERESEALMADYGYEKTWPQAPTIIIGNLTITSYDPVTGWCYFDPSVNFNSVLKDYVMVDSSSTPKTYAITGILNESGNKRIGIAVNLATPPVSPVSIQAQSSLLINRYLTVGVEHNIELSVHTKDAFITKNLIYILIYFLSYYKIKMQYRWLQLSTWRASPFIRTDLELPQQVYSRSITFSAFTRWDWIDGVDPVANAITPVMTPVNEDLSITF